MRLVLCNTSASDVTVRFGGDVYRNTARCRARSHAIVSTSTARAAAGGATVVQLRLKGAPTAQVVALGRALGELDAELVVNDDVEAALELGCGVHLGQSDPGIERAREAGIPLGISVAKRREARSRSSRERPTSARGRSGRRRRRPTRARRSGSTGSRDICLSVSVPGGGDRRHRRVERGRLHSRRRGRRRRHPRRRRDRGAAGGGRCGSLRPASSGCCASSSRAG